MEKTYDTIHDFHHNDLLFVSRWLGEDSTPFGRRRKKFHRIKVLDKKWKHHMRKVDFGFVFNRFIHEEGQQINFSRQKFSVDNILVGKKHHDSISAHTLMS